MPEYSSPDELAADLYNRAVQPGDSGIDRLKIAIRSTHTAREVWAERVDFGEETGDAQ